MANQRFTLKNEQWRRFLFLYLVAFLFIVGINLAKNVVPALFVSEFGAKLLPLIFIGNSILTFLSTLVYMNFIDRVSNAKILFVICLGSLMAIFGGYALYKAGLDIVGVSVLFLLYYTIRIVFSLHWGVYANSFYDTRSAKRFMPMLSSAISLGGISAALGMSVFSKSSLFTADVIVILWGVLLGVVALLSMVMSATLGGPPDAPPKPSASFSKNIREGCTFVLNSPFLRWLNTSMLLVMIVITLLELQAFRIFEEKLGTTAGISGFTANIDLVASLALLFVEMFLVARIINKIGLGNTHLIYPVVTFVTAALTDIFPPVLLIGALAYVDINALRMTLHSNTNNLLYNAVPLSVAGRTRAFTNGIIKPLGVLIAGLLSYILPVIDLDWLPSAMLIVLSAIYVFSELRVRQLYRPALIKMLEADNLAFSPDIPTELFVADTTTLDYLKSKFAAAENNHIKLLVATVLSELDFNEFLKIIQNERERGGAFLVSLLEVLNETGRRSQEIETLYLDLVRDSQPEIRRLAVIGLQGTPQADLWLGLAHDPDVRVQVEALSWLFQSKEPAHVETARQALVSIAGHPDASTRIWALQLMKRLEVEWVIELLTASLADSSEVIRLNAALALEELSPKTPLQAAIRAYAAPSLIQNLHDPSERIQLAAVQTLGNIADSPALFETLLPMLTSRKPLVRNAAADVVLSHLDRLPQVHQILTTTEDRALRRMLGAVLARDNKSKYSDCVWEGIREDLRAIYTDYIYLQPLRPLVNYKGVQVFISTLEEENDYLLDECMFLLSALNDQQSLDIVSKALESKSQRNRSGALEALETIMPPSLFSLMLPLFIYGDRPEKLVETGENCFDLHPLSVREVFQHFLSAYDQPWLQGVVTFILGELGATIQIQQHEHEHKPARRASLLSKLDDSAPASHGSGPYTLDEIRVLLNLFVHTRVSESLKVVAKSAQRMLDHEDLISAKKDAGSKLSAIERVIYLKAVPFFSQMPIEQLQILAGICDEELLPEGSIIFQENDPGGVLYVLVAGKVGIEKQNPDGRGRSVRVEDVAEGAFFGGESLFDNSLHPMTAVALTDVLTLKINHEVITTAILQSSRLALEMIAVLSTHVQENLRELSRRSASHTDVVENVFSALG